MESGTPKDQQRLAPMTVADGAEVQHGGGQAQREADRDEIKRSLRGGKSLSDVRQGHIADSQIDFRYPATRIRVINTTPASCG
jgi:hypothetical protein